MTFEHPKVKTTSREGCEVGDGERQIYFNDGREPSQYFLIKRGFVLFFRPRC